MSRSFRALFLVAAALLACERSPKDELGPQPQLDAPVPFVAPAPVTFDTGTGLSIWLLERHMLPLVSVELVVPVGSAADPPGAAGLAHITADMLDEGAGARDGVALARALAELGATLELGVWRDGSSASLTVMKRSFAAAFSLFADVVGRPRFDPDAWRRTHELWRNELARRGDDALAVADLVGAAALYGPTTPYGHPADGTLAAAQRIDLAAVKAFYAGAWRPDHAVLVAVGDLSREELLQVLERDLGNWRAPRGPASTARPPAVEPRWKAPRLVLVDRPDATQSVISVVRGAVRAADPQEPLLELVNTTLGGIFTSRLNQNLREMHGWTYGASSQIIANRRAGLFWAQAAVSAEATAPAIEQTLAELNRMARACINEAELRKACAQEEALRMTSYEGVESTAEQLASLAMLGLPPDYDAKVGELQRASSVASLAPLCSAVDPKAATVVVVGPAQRIEESLATLGLGEPERWDAEGEPRARKAFP